MTEIILPDLPGGVPAPVLPATSQVSIIGANGAGKTRFMQALTERCGDKAYCLSAMNAFFPERKPSNRPGSIDVLYEKATKTQPYLSTSAMSELDKLAHLLIADEIRDLMYQKAVRHAGIRLPRRGPTKLDTVVELWKSIFPGSHILSEAGALLFSNNCDEEAITTDRLSSGEKAVFYYIAAVLYAPQDAVVFIDSPSMFMHPAMLGHLWNSIEELRPDCRFVYNTLDIDFVSSRTANACIWVKSYDASRKEWDYEVLPRPILSEELFLDIIGTRKPVLFIEGDATHSIDGKLYPLVFREYTVKPLGSCDKVIESTRSFNDLKQMHHLDSHGIVDRDRRTDAEVGYLRRKNILVPEVAEVENIFLLEDVVKTMAGRRRRDPDAVAEKVRREVMRMFARQYDAQALMHVRHRVKREMECRVDGRFTCITAMETHLRNLADKLRPREQYEQLRAEFQGMIERQDYAGVLKVFNHKPMLADCGVDRMLGFRSKEEYVADVIRALKGSGREAEALRNAVKRCFGLGPDEKYLPGMEPLEPAPRRRTAPSVTGDDAVNNSATESGRLRQRRKKKKSRDRRSSRQR